MMKRVLSVLLTLTLTVSMLSMATLTPTAAGKGDFNNDGRVDTVDVRAMMQLSVNNGTPTTQQLLWGDYDMNNEITTTDARAVLKVTMTSLTSDAPNYAKPTGDDWWGENAISVLGDSISFGVGSQNTVSNSNPQLSTGGIPECSYISYVKKAVQAANDGKMNYGFTSAYPTSWNPRSEELHAWPERSNTSDGATAWVCDSNDDGNRLMWIGMTSQTAWSTITYKLRQDYMNSYDYFCIYYYAEPDAAAFCVADGNGGEVADVDGSKSYINTAATEAQTKRTAFYKLSDCPKDDNGAPQIIICHDGTANPVTITGIGYYKALPQANDADGYVTFNSYTRGGSSLIKTSDLVIRQAVKADTFILALGFNDSFFHSNAVRVLDGEFAAKIDLIIEEANKNGTQVIVNDYVWDNTTYFEKTYGSSSEEVRNDILEAMALVRSELKRLAQETNGIYVNQQALCGEAIIEDLNTAGDGVHPSDAGHRMMAQTLVEALGLEWTEEWT